jgi:hypothetical protein
MPEPLVMLAYFAPMAGVFGLFWNVARKLAEIETDMRHVRKENDRLRADVQALRDLLSVILDQRRA